MHPVQWLTDKYIVLPTYIRMRIGDKGILAVMNPDRSITFSRSKTFQTLTMATHYAYHTIGKKRPMAEQHEDRAAIERTSA